MAAKLYYAVSLFVTAVKTINNLFSNCRWTT